MGKNPYETEYCEKHDKWFDDYCEACKDDHDDFATDMYEDDRLDKENA